MTKLNNLSELRTYVKKVVGIGFDEVVEEYTATYTNSLGSHTRGIVTGWKNMRFVLVRCLDSSLKACARKNKAEGDVELMVIRKTCLLSGGLTPKDWEKAIAKSAIFLESVGLYPDREPFSDKTRDLF